MKMKCIGAQGEVRIYKIEEIPSDVKKVDLEKNDSFIVGHSETGHHHVLVAERPPKVYEAEKVPEGMRVLYALLDAPGTVEHQRGFDTHESFGLDSGKYMFRNDREFDAYEKLARRVAD